MWDRRNLRRWSRGRRLRSVKTGFLRRVCRIRRAGTTCNSDQWRYEKEFTDYHTVPKGAAWAKGHTADLQVQAVRNGWLPFYRNSTEGWRSGWLEDR